MRTVKASATTQVTFLMSCKPVLPPWSSKLNGGVERAHRTHTEEIYEITNSTFELSQLRSDLLEWEKVYNTVRPHQAMGYLTPLKFFRQSAKGGQCKRPCYVKLNCYRRPPCCFIIPVTEAELPAMRHNCSRLSFICFRSLTGFNP